MENKPKGAIVMIDEAYIHLCGEPMCSDLVAKDKDVVILRTFSKIYGMAGIRAGAAFGRPDLLPKLGSTPPARCRSPRWPPRPPACRRRTVVPERRKIIGDVRE